MAGSFTPPRFYPILDTGVLRTRRLTAIAVAESLLASGAKILQYRHKQLWTQQEFDEAKELSLLCRRSDVLFVLNDRADFAHLLRAGLHVGQDDLLPIAARKIIGDDVVLGFSTHNRQQLIYAAEEPVQYLSIGPIFATTSKANPDPVVGIDGLAKLRPLANKPIVAIGGITAENARSVLEAGANSVAVISGILPEGCRPSDLRKVHEDWIGLTNSS